MTRGEIVVVTARGAYTGKPRPALIIQADVYNETHASLTVCPITSEVVDAPLFRVALLPGARTGLTAPSQVMADKIVSAPRSAVHRTIGRCDAEELTQVEAALRRWLDL